MKILYSIRDSFSAAEQLSSFKKEIDCKVMGFYQSTKSLGNVDWLLDGLYLNASPKDATLAYQKYKLSLPKIRLDLFEILLKDVKRFNPQLIISDIEPISAIIAKILDIPYWSVSSLHLIDQVHIPSGFLNKKIFNSLRYYLRTLPTADKVFISSPFADFFDFESKTDWVRPYYSISNEIQEQCLAIIHPSRQRLQQGLVDYGLEVFDNAESVNLESCEWILTDGHSSNISKALYCGLGNIYSSYHLDDLETFINSSLLEFLDLGKCLPDLNKIPNQIPNYLDDLSKHKIVKQLSSESRFQTLGEMILNL